MTDVDSLSPTIHVEMNRKTIPKNIRDQVKQKYNGRCGYCGEKKDVLQIDHVVPIAHFHGTNDISNLMPACISCNNYKDVFSVEQFRSEISQQVERLRKYSMNFRLAERYGLVVETTQKVEFYFETVKHD